MANIVINYKCNNKCDFCFVDSININKRITIDQIKQYETFFKSFNRNSMNIVGGEPTLNSDFLAILLYFLRREYKITIFSNGKLKPALIEELQNIQEGEFFFCVNRSMPTLTENIETFYRKLGYRINPSLTVFQKNQKLDHIFEEIEKYNLNPYYRIGIALPIWPERQNKYLAIDDYGIVSDRIFKLIQKGVSKNIRPSFDCGFPYCFFSEEQKKYFNENRIMFSSNCGIIPDIIPDFLMIPCFPFSKFQKQITSNSNWNEMSSEFKNDLNSYSFNLLFKKCANCEDLRSGKCCGGCAAFRVGIK